MSDVRYTLSSYEPVSLSVVVPYATASDIQAAAAAMAAEEGGSETDSKNLSWVRKNLGFETMPAFMAAARRKVEEEFEEQAHAACGPLALAELSKRLEQEPDEALFKRLREDAAIQLKIQLDQARMSLKVFMGRNNLSVEQLNQMLDAQAAELARQQAAISAFADERGIVAGEDEWPQLLRLPDKMARGLIDKARREGRYDGYAMAARGAKALKVVLSEAVITVVRETAEQAREREAQEN